MIHEISGLVGEDKYWFNSTLEILVTVGKKKFPELATLYSSILHHKRSADSMEIV